MTKYNPEYLGGSLTTPEPPNVICRGCGISVDQPTRPQGGGSIKRFCSPRCRSRIWAQDNRAKLNERRRQSSQRRPRKDAPERCKTWRRISRLRRYGLTPASFNAMLFRQRGKCLGCGRPFTDELVPNIDHDHVSGQTRGLLCSSCNSVLGFIREDREVLTRLSAYLELDRSQRLVYVIGSLRNPKVCKIAALLRTAGYDVFDDYMAVGPEADDYWQKYEKQRGHSFAEALKGRAADHVFYYDKSYLDLADAVVMVLPANRSSHLELGYMAGTQKPCIIFGEEEPDRFDVMVQFATVKAHNEVDLLRVLATLLEEVELPSQTGIMWVATPEGEGA